MGRYVGGFGLVKNVTPKEWAAAKPDPIAQFSAPVCGHMNQGRWKIIIMVSVHGVIEAAGHDKRLVCNQPTACLNDCSTNRQPPQPTQLALSSPCPALRPALCAGAAATQIEGATWLIESVDLNLTN